MKNQLISLPGLKHAAVTFLALRNVAASEIRDDKVFCADKNRKVIEKTNCNGTKPVDTTFLFRDNDSIPPLDSVVDNNITMYDSSLTMDRQMALLPPDQVEPAGGVEARGFGRRDIINLITGREEDCDDDGGIRMAGGIATGFAAGAIVGYIAGSHTGG